MHYYYYYCYCCDGGGEGEEDIFNGFFYGIKKVLPYQMETHGFLSSL